jgi:SAM-dependent methyltransferase
MTGVSPFDGSSEGSASSDFQAMMKPHGDAYRQGRWRALIMLDLVLEEMRRLGPAPTVLDIGCGTGFDDSPELQARIGSAAGRYVGVEPDTEVACPQWMHEVHRCSLEEAPIEPGSVQVAFAIMVLEHVTNPREFFGKLQTVLAPKGVFWGLTVDGRHWFKRASRLLEALRIKNWYLDRLAGRRGAGRYLNYPTAYRANSPSQIERLAQGFANRDFTSFHRIGQLDYYLPAGLRAPAALVDRLLARLGRPGAILICRLAK